MENASDWVITEITIYRKSEFQLCISCWFGERHDHMAAPNPWHNGGMPTSRRSSKRPYAEPYRELNMDVATGGRRIVERRGEDWTVQKVRSSEKSYVCPGCNHEISPGTPHIVAWASDSLFGREAALAARRHWHVNCWNGQE